MKQCFYLLVISLCLLLAGCNSSTPSVSLDNTPVVAKKVMVDGEEVIDLDLALLKDTLVFPLSQFAEEMKVVKLESSDEAMILPYYIPTLSANYMAIRQGWGKTCKLFDIQGKFIGDIGAAGQGPGEYTYIYKIIIDEPGGSIYMLSSNTESLLVYDLRGKHKESIPLVRKVRKATFQLAGDQIIILNGPSDDGEHNVWVQNRRGELLYDIPSNHFGIPFNFSNEIFSDNNTGEVNYHFWIWQAKPDTLYQVDLEKRKLLPRITATFSTDEVPPHVYQEWNDYYIGNNNTVVTVSFNDEDGNMQMKQEGEEPDYYIVDKKTLKGSWFKLENDYFGNELIKYPLVFQDGYYVQNIDPGDLEEKIDGLLKRSDLSDTMRQKLTDIMNDISDNDNNYILYAKMR